MNFHLCKNKKWRPNTTGFATYKVHKGGQEGLLIAPGEQLFPPI